MSISVLGSGAWGTALSHVLSSQDTPVVLWSRSQERIQELSLSFSIQKKNIFVTSDLEAACNARIILIVTPAQSFGAVANQIAGLVDKSTSLVLCAKGIDSRSGQLLHKIAGQEFGSERVAALSGPSFAHDVLLGLPTAVSLAAEDIELAKTLSKLLARPRFRIYASDDIVGVEIGGALKNVLALAVGAARGLNLGASAEAALIARGFAEMNRLAMAMGAKAETLSGLSGLGDLVLTCSSPQSRNFSYGMAMALNQELDKRPLAEGVFSAQKALELAQNLDVAVPIIEMVNRVLGQNISASEAVDLLLSRPLKTEE